MVVTTGQPTRKAGRHDDPDHRCHADRRAVLRDLERDRPGPALLDVTVAELMIEAFYPADTATADVLRAAAAASA